MTKIKANRTVVLIILGLLSAIGPFSIDLYLPAFDTIPTDYDVSIDRVQLSLSSFFVGVALGQMIYGPLLDKYGRKKPLIFGLALYCVASLLCTTASSVEQLIVFRFLQALGSCSGMVAARAMVRDYYDSQEAAKVFSLLMLVIAVSPILAPSFGAFLIAHFDWHYLFIVLFVLGALILAATIFILPESYQGNKNFSLKPAAIVQKFWAVLINPTFLTYCAVGSIASAGLYAYLAGSSFVMQQVYGLTESQYGLAFAFVAFAMLTATQLNRFFLNRWHSIKISIIANGWHSLVGVSLIFFYYTGLLSFPILLIGTFFYLFGHGFIFPNTSAMALTPFKELAGSASALLGCVQMALGGVASAAVSYLHDGTALPMIGVMCACAVLALIIHLFTRIWVFS